MNVAFGSRELLRKIRIFCTIRLVLGAIPYMLNSTTSFSLELFGSFRLLDRDGRRIEIASKRGKVLIAMLATAGGGERTRSWIQSRLWGSRQLNQAQGSLRRELSNLKTVLNRGKGQLINSDHNCLWLDLSQISIDARNADNYEAIKDGEFLEGIDIAGEDEFEDWLRQQRTRFDERKSISAPADAELDRSGKTTAISEEIASDWNDLPAIAVLPFDNHTDDPQNDFLGEGLSEDLIDRFSRLRWLPVIARSSSFAYSHNNSDPKAIGEKLGARYILGGQLRKIDGQFDLTASLSDARNNRLVWTNKVSMPLDPPQSLLNELVSGLTGLLEAKIDREEQSHALYKLRNDIRVSDLIWRGRYHLNKLTKQDSAISIELFQKAVLKEPNSPEAVIQLAFAKLFRTWATRGSHKETTEIRELAQQAIIADYEDARGYLLAAITEVWMRHPSRAKAMFGRALALNPSLAMAHAHLGGAFNLEGQPESALGHLQKAIRLSPNDQQIFYAFGELAMAYLSNGELNEAVKHADQALIRRPAYWYASLIKCIALKQTGALSAALSIYSSILNDRPDFGAEYVEWLPFVNAEFQKKLKDELRKIERLHLAQSQ